MPAKRYWVTGRVQGVWFRAATRELAEGLGLDGWVRNLPDGRVEALAAGPEEALRAFEGFLHEGPAGARVDLVEEERAEPPSGNGFHVLR